MEKPYVGITGFTTRTEVDRVLAAVPEMTHSVMIGVLANEMTLSGHNAVHNPLRYPRMSELSGLFRPDHRTINLIHYQTAAPASLFDQLCELVELGGRYLQGFEINMSDPPLQTLRRFKACFPAMKLALRINRDMFRRADFRPGTLARHVCELGDLVDYAIVDLTYGDGVPCSPDLVHKILHEMRDAEVAMCPGVGGGLGVYTISPLKTMLREFPELCLDADVRLRNDHDRLAVDMAIEYLDRFARMASS